MGYLAKSSRLGLHATTVLAVRRGNVLSMGADGQATMGDFVAKQHVRKLRRLYEDQILVGFAGATADAFTLLERLEEKLNTYGGHLMRSAMELAKDWRTDRYLRRLEAMMITANHEHLFLLSGEGDVIEPENNVAAIGSGGMYAQAAALALLAETKSLSASQIVEKSLHIAADICIYTNHHLVIETLEKDMKKKVTS